jgi:hypothetical protein
MRKHQAFLKLGVPQANVVCGVGPPKAVGVCFLAVSWLRGADWRKIDR